MNGVSRIESGRYSCPVCPSRFVSLSEKKHHLKTKHPKGAKR